MDQDKKDNVNSPNHYTGLQHPLSGLEVIDLLEGLGFDRDYYLGNVLKYLARHKLKGKPLEDLKKARYYLDRKIKRLEDSNIKGV